LTLPLDRGGDLAHNVYDALEDETAQPLRDLEHEVPEGLESFTELETSLSEWSFGFGIAWALARVREPFASSRRVSELAAEATATAWRAFGDEPWRTLIAADRSRRGPQAAPESGDAREMQPDAPVAHAEQPTPEPELEDFMGGLARARSRRPRERDEQPGPQPGSDPSSDPGPAPGAP
jgi:hypothetical protein